MRRSRRGALVVGFGRGNRMRAVSIPTRLARLASLLAAMAGLTAALAGLARLWKKR